MENRLKIDNLGRILIPKKIRDSLEFKDFIYYEVNDAKELRLYNAKRRNARENILVRLNKKDITQGERNFLNKLLEII